MPRALLLSIRPKYAEKIFNGTKTIELRRVRPRLSAGDLVFVYASSPVKALLGGFEVACVVAGPPSELWDKVKSEAGVNRCEFNDYFKGARQGFGIVLRKAWPLDKPIKLEKLRSRKTNFRPPQSYHYFSQDETIRMGFDKIFFKSPHVQNEQRSKSR